MAKGIGFAPNYTYLNELDITPEGPTRTWARLAGGISTIEPDGNEEVAQDPYYDGDGMSSADVTGGQMILSVSGHRKVGDPAQDYVAGLQFAYGESRRTRFRMTGPDGEVVEADVTIANIVGFGANGDANAKSDYEFEIHFNGSPTTTPPSKDSLPESVTVEDVTVEAGKTAAVGEAVAPDTASARCVYEVEDEGVAAMDADGTVRGVKEGTTRAVCKAAAKPSVRAVFSITVTAVPATADEARVDESTVAQG